MGVQASDIMKLRASTGAGMMDCKNALEEAGGDMEKAADLLRKKGIIKAAKRADKVAADGRVDGVVTADEKAGALVEVNCETDFVAKSDDFIAFSKEVAAIVADNNPADMEALLKQTLPNGKTIAEQVGELTLKIGEKISVRRFTRFASEAGKVYIYLHGTKIGVVLELQGGNGGVGVDVAMHVAASNPKYLNRTQVDAAEVEKEKAVYVEQLKQQNKPANIIENIVKGKLDRFYSEICLLEQPFIKDEDKKVEQFVKEQGGTIVRFARYELGEGIEKVTKDFAAEVAEQLK